MNFLGVVGNDPNYRLLNAFGLWLIFLKFYAGGLHSQFF